MFLRRAIPLSSKIFAVVAVVLGAAAFLVVRAERERYAVLLPAVGPPATVVVTRTPLTRGSVVSATNLDTVEVPEAFVQPGALSSIKDAAGSVLAADVAAGEQLTRIRLASSSVGSLAALVPEGLRAIGVAAPVPAGLAAGDRVDVLATYGSEGRVYTETVGIALEVLRVGAPGGVAFAGAGPGDGDSTLILLASPDVAQRLATASTLAAVHVAVVGPSGNLALPSAGPVSG
jgi:Flp pilus assembly protein CpaB